MNVNLVTAIDSDWDFILSLRNDFYSFFDHQIKPLTKNEHYEYLKKQENNLNFHHWIIIFNDQPVGYVRLLNSDVGIMLKKEFQNKGIASNALKLVENEAKLLGILKLFAKVQIENSSSHKIFKKNNYNIKFYLLEKDLK